MAWAIITIYISKCAQINPQQLPKTSKFYSKCKKCDIEATLGGWVPPPLEARRLSKEIVSTSPKTTSLISTFNNNHGSCLRIEYIQEISYISFKLVILVGGMCLLCFAQTVNT